MTRFAAPALFLLLAACGGEVAEVTVDADSAAENATSAKTLEDLAAAERAARQPMPKQVEPLPPTENKSGDEARRGARESDTAGSADESNDAELAPQG